MGLLRVFILYLDCIPRLLCALISDSLNSFIRGDGAYEKFKEIANEFYKDASYKFVGLKLESDPKTDHVEFTAEFWSV